MTAKERNAAISVKVSNEEKEKLQNKAEALSLSTSDFVRIKALSDNEDIARLMTENRKLRSKNKELEVGNGFSIRPNCEESLVISCTTEQQEILKKLFAGIHDGQISFEERLLCVLIEAAICPKWKFPSGTFLRRGRDFTMQGGGAHLCLLNRSSLAKERNIPVTEIVNNFKNYVSPALLNEIEDTKF